MQVENRGVPQYMPQATSVHDCSDPEIFLLLLPRSDYSARRAIAAFIVSRLEFHGYFPGLESSRVHLQSLRHGYYPIGQLPILL